MKYSLVALTLAATTSTSTAAPIDVDQLASYTFEDYQQEFMKNYRTEELRRKAFVNFQTNRLDVLTHNKKRETQRGGWHKAMNQFSDMSSEEFSKSHGWVPSAAISERDLSSFQTSENMLNIPNSFKLKDLPKTVDWREKGVVSPIKNQGMCGSCWAFSSTENIESHVALHSNLTTAPILSPQNLVSCDPNPKHCGGKGGCLGSVPELAFDWVKTNGLASEADWPYVSGHTSLNEPCNNTAKPTAHITGYVKLKANNYTEVMFALANIGPVAVNVDAIPMQNYGGGLMTGCALDDTHIDHVVQLVGYGHDDDANKDYWIMRNSWGETWGIAGYMHLLRHDPSEHYCSLDIYPLDGTGCTGGPGTLNVCGSCGVLFDVSYPTGGTLA